MKSTTNYPGHHCCLSDCKVFVEIADRTTFQSLLGNIKYTQVKSNNVELPSVNNSETPTITTKTTIDVTSDAQYANQLLSKT